MPDVMTSAGAPTPLEPPVIADGVTSLRSDSSRVAVVQATGLLDSDAEEAFDRLTHLAVRLLRVPAAFISLVDSDRDFFKSSYGLGEPLGTSRVLRGQTFCRFAIGQDAPLVIPDTAADPVYRDVPSVLSLGVAAYVGVPLIVRGQRVGAFCAIDSRPHAWTADEVAVLVELAASAQREIELRGALASSEVAMVTLARQRAELERQTHELQTTSVDLALRTDEAEAANRAKSGFLSMMSHELRTPLNAIGGYADLLATGVGGPMTAPQHDYLASIQRATRHLTTLIADILEFARLDGGKVAFRMLDVAVEEVVRDAAELVASHMAERRITFEHDECHVVDRACALRTDPAKLRQVLVNLLANAVKFSPEGGRVRVSYLVDEARIVTCISDNGCGISTADLSQIFEPFVQINRARVDGPHQGVGLGLAICRELVRGMDGELTVESEVGRGSTFSIALARARPAAA